MHQFEKAGPVVAVGVAVVLLAGCGSQAGGTAGARRPTSGAGACGVASASPSARAKDGVRITAVSAVCAEYEVTNGTGEAADVTVLFSRTGASGGAVDNVTKTVEGLAPGAVGKGRVELGGTASGVKVLRVRSVPSAEASRPNGPCPASGVLVSADEGDAAMGLRVVGLRLRNCGTADVALNGYPELQVLDVERRPVDGVQVVHGGARIASGTGADDPPRAFTLKPGEAAGSTLVWRNTTEGGAPVNAPYVRVRATPGAAPVTVTPELDLGTTGRLGVGAWVRDDAASPTPGR